MGYTISVFISLENNTPSTLLKRAFWTSTVIVVRFEQPKNAHSPIEITLFGIVTLVKSVSANAHSPMEVTLFGIVTLAKDVSANARSPMEVTLFGIVTLVNGVPANA
jgi:hypothetical protein